MAFSFLQRLRRQPVILYQPGRVASHALWETLNAVHPCVTTHTFANTPLAQEVRRRIESGERGWQVISLVRDPVARNLSHFFKQMENPRHAFYLGDRASIERLEISEMIRFFFQVPQSSHDVPLFFFGGLFRELFHVDVFTGDFDRKRKSQWMESYNARVLLLRTEDLAETGGKEVARFLGLSRPLVIPILNDSDTKWYAARFRQFLREIRFPTEYLERIYGSALVRHFYSAEEIASLREKWERGASPGSGLLQNLANRSLSSSE